MRNPWLVVASLAAILGAGAPVPPPAPPPLGDRIGRALGAAPAHAEFGVAVVSLPGGQALFGRDADRLFAPASNLKLATTAAALSRLGPDFRFKTRLYQRGALEGGVARGDLGVVGGGDPNLSGRFWGDDPEGPFRDWAKRLKSIGIRAFEGDLVLDDGYLDREGVHPSWPKDQLQEWYCAPTSALAFNDDCVEVRISPGLPGGAATVSLRPPLARFRPENDVRTVADRGRHRYSILRSPDGWGVAVRGAFYQNAEPASEFVTVPDPAAFFGEALRDALASEGIEVRGTVRAAREGEAPGTAGWTLLLEHVSTLEATVSVANKRSQNLYAEQILKVLGKEARGEGSFAKGAEAVRDYLKDVGVPLDGVVIEDGSGLSRDNRIAADHLCRVLVAMWNSPRKDAFVGSLAVAGRDGTLEKRLKGPDTAGRILGKTGTIAGASALSGYARAGEDRWCAFSILARFDPAKTSLADVRKAEDRIAAEIAKGP